MGSGAQSARLYRQDMIRRVAVVWDSMMRTAVATDGREGKIYRVRSVVKLRLWAFVRRKELVARSASPQSYACVFFFLFHDTFFHGSILYFYVESFE